MELVATNVLREAAVDAIAADAGTIAPAANACHVHLVIADFDPDGETDVTALTLATFTGSAAKSAGIGAQQSFVDQQEGKRVVQLLEPAGGWTYICTVAPAAPETVYGVVVTDNADAVTLAAGKLDAPVTVSEVGHSVSIDNLRLSVPVSVFQ